MMVVVDAKDLGLKGEKYKNQEHEFSESVSNIFAEVDSNKSSLTTRSMASQERIRVNFSKDSSHKGLFFGGSVEKTAYTGREDYNSSDDSDDNFQS
eukprot:CAMPEP_0205805564 /NCGR_PEP_ID=MMETSP0205-20121125/8834_1 /ASSEMBLY_ACC=CAM_ASM_000278 /TAXON_ID=36767 /ORGANISM="Euplotes focardii, Strain TN1" /LENGTH=95 /DNA_ID=CAMNT_0053077001 /DNA_START=1014 /DNA_END=1301 /DNA_ORIENTATION=+